jgi:hypothetical protein
VDNNLITRNPAASAERPGLDDTEVGQVLDQDQLTALVNGFKGSTIYEIVCVAAFTGMRRGEILALRWTDLDLANKTLRIERALEYNRKHGLAFKSPKTARGRRTIAIDGFLAELLRKEQEKYLRLVAGIPDGAAIDLSLVRLPEEALVFPAPDAPGCRHKAVHGAGGQAGLPRASVPRPAGFARNPIAGWGHAGAYGRQAVRPRSGRPASHLCQAHQKERRERSRSDRETDKDHPLKGLGPNWVHEPTRCPNVLGWAMKKAPWIRRFAGLAQR